MDRSTIAGTTDHRERGRLPHRRWRSGRASVGEALAGEAGITLTPRHWAVLEYLQQRVPQATAPLSIRRIGKSGVTDIKEFYQLFPVAPLKTASKIAGIPKPASCI